MFNNYYTDNVLKLIMTDYNNYYYIRKCTHWTNNRSLTYTVDMKTYKYSEWIYANVHHYNVVTGHVIDGDIAKTNLLYENVFP